MAKGEVILVLRIQHQRQHCGDIRRLSWFACL